MCGLVGVVNREKAVLDSNKLEKIYTQLLYADALRGTHGTGLLSVTNKGEVYTLKKALPASDFIDLGRYKNIVDTKNNVFLLGHNRFATQGAHTSDNAHPFQQGYIHLFHNGTLHNHNSLSKRAFTVDSDALAYFISDQDDTAKALGEVDGAFSLVWYNEFLETLNFARNKERPMFIAILDSGSMVYASEKEMLLWVCSRNGLDVTKDLFELEVGKWLQVPLDAEVKPTLTPFTPKVDDYANYYDTRWYNYNKADSRYSKTKTFKYSYLEGTVIKLTPSTWTPYADGNFTGTSFGYMSAWSHNEELEVRISSVVKSKVDELLGKEQSIKLTSCTSDNLIWGSLVPNNEKKKEKVVNISKIGSSLYLNKTSFMGIIRNGCTLCCCTILPSEAVYVKDINKADEILCEDCAKEHDDYDVKLEAFN